MSILKQYSVSNMAKSELKNGCVINTNPLEQFDNLEEAKEFAKKKASSNDHNFLYIISDYGNPISNNGKPVYLFG